MEKDLQITVRKLSGEILSRAEAEKYVLVAWFQKEEGDVTSMVYQDSPGDLKDVEWAIIRLAKVLQNNKEKSQLYAMIGHVVEQAVYSVVEEAVSAIAAKE